MNRWSRFTIAVLGALCLAVAIRARWAAEDSPGQATIPTPTPIATSHVPEVTPELKSPAEPWAIGPRTEQAREARASAIRETMEVIRAECQRNAGGDWSRWSKQLQPVREDLTRKIRTGKALNPTATGYFEARSPVMEGRDNFPLFESAPDHYLLHVIDPASLDSFRKEQPVAIAVRWLKQQGIDVIFVPVPKMTEVYPEYFTDHCPSDRIIAPHVRQALLELLEADVEVVDLWHAFQEERDKDLEPLYLPADPHWGPRAQAIAVRLVAARLEAIRLCCESSGVSRHLQVNGYPIPAREHRRDFPGTDSRSTATSPGGSTAILSRRDRPHSSPIRGVRPRGLHRRQL